eukprot:CAMPEP_0185729356 /NCGR_PEP_ID=MMETSP1171-20130828/5333_1 /TAXON_ID=374046 /ORGANISM="Helicotheca tamensis, Strain CCMP826" /LENGTH=510 /DNA_ID=CAMNT_0028398175 /DNA_START=90 /DNA_END=1622 /DNA_ORIENTATION=-
METTQPPAIASHVRPEDAATHITVSDPVQHQDGMNKYTSYRVDVRGPLPSENPPNGQVVGGDPSIFQNAGYSAVLRRYSDFLWLYERLHKERAGAIVPPIPDKQAVARFSAAFVEDRRVKLETFLRRVSVHPELCDAKCLETFLRADDVTFYAAKNAKGGVDTAMMMSIAPNNATAMTPQKKEGFKKWFAEAKASISGDLVRSPDDDIFQEIERYINGLDLQMRSVAHQASGLVRKGKEIANGMFEFGLAFNLLGQSEADSLGAALSKVGEAADSLSVLSADHAEKEMAQFEEPLQDYIKMIHAVKLALQRRHEMRLSYTTCLNEVEHKQTNVAKLRATIGAEAKAYSAEMSLKRARDAADAARDEFATVSQRVLREVDRFKREKADDMRKTVLDYINLQIEYNKRMEEVWGALVPQLENVQIDGNVVPNNTRGNIVTPPPTVQIPQQGMPTQGQQQMPQQIPTSPPPAQQPPMIPQQQIDNVAYMGGPPMGGQVQYRDPNVGFTPMPGM